MNIKKLTTICLVGGIVLSLILPIIFQSNAYIVDLFISILIWATVAQSWIILAGIGGMWSLGHIAFFGFGAYVTAFFSTQGIPIILGFPFGALCSGIVAFALGFFVCRLQGHYFTLVTFIFSIGMGVLFRYFDKYTGGDYGLSVPLKISPSGIWNLAWDGQIPYYILALMVSIFCTIVVWLIVKSGFGLKLSAIREDVRASKAVGIHVFRLRLITFCVGSVLASLAGTVYVSYYKLIEPTTAFGMATALNPIIFSVAGGVGSIFGGLVGATILVPISSFLNMFATNLPGIDRVIYGLLLMILIALLPKGLLGLMKKKKAHP
jgi:branched-chain amino acid transport system permease protein